MLCYLENKLTKQIETEIYVQGMGHKSLNHNLQAGHFKRVFVISKAHMVQHLGVGIIVTFFT